MVSRWLQTPTEAGLLARAMLLETTRVYLRAGHDVVVPQVPGSAGVRGYPYSGWSKTLAPSSSR